MKISTIWAILLLLLVTATPTGAASGPYDSLIQAHMKQSATATLDQAKKAMEQKDERKALVLYMTVSNRKATNDMEKEENALAYLRSGDIYYWKGHYSKALSLYVEGMKLCEETKHKRKIIEFYKCFGNVYCMFKDYNKAIDYYKKGYALREKYPDDEVTYRLMMSLCYTYYLLDDFHNMSLSYQLGEKIPHDNRPEFVFFDSFYLALINKSEGRNDMAKALLKSLENYSHSNTLPPHYICSVYEEMALLYEKEGDTKNMFHYLELCFNSAEKTGQLHMFTEVINKLSQYYRHKGDLAKANYYGERYRQTTDSTFNLRELYNIRNEQFEYEMEKIDKDIVTLMAQNENRQSLIYLQWVIIAVALIILAAVGIMLFVIYRQSRVLKENYHSLFAINRRMGDMHRQIAKSTATPELEAPQSVNSGNSQQDDSLRKTLVAKIASIMDHTKVYTDPTFSVERLATLAGASCSEVEQVVKENFGKSFDSYIDEYRVRLACQMLGTPDSTSKYTVNGIGCSVGYTSSSEFTDTFRRITGISPSAYQKMANRELEAEATSDDTGRRAAKAV